MNNYQFQRFISKAQNNIRYYLLKIPKITRYLLLTLLLMFILQNFINMYPLVLQSLDSGRFNPLQMITYAFLHGNFAHLFFNALALWMFGSQIEEYWGEKRYLTFVIVSIVGAALLHLLFSNNNVIGISGLVFALLLAYGMMWPDRVIMLVLPPMPVKAKYMVLGYGILLFMNILSSRNDGIAHFAHLGGALSGYLLIQYWRGKPPFSKPRRKR